MPQMTQPSSQLTTLKCETKLGVKILLASGAKQPLYATELAAGADLTAYIEKALLLPSGESIAVPTGLRIALPVGYEMQIRPRSGLAKNHCITVLNTPGTIDADYRGEIQVLLINHGKKDFIIEPNMRIAQAIIAPVMQACFIPVDSLDSTLRGEGGFGHTGLNA
jgi:dUTP pyrophosphatase